MMKIKVITALLLALSLPVIGYASGGSEIGTLKNSNCFNWYCKKSESGNPPPLPTEFSFIKEYGGYYLDEDATEDDKVIYLTFDCGYENGNIEKILDTLKKHDASGAFFVLKNLVKKNPELVTRMVNEGHLVCNHTSNHKDMTKITSIEEFRKVLDELNSVMLETIGKELCPFYRPPEGKFNLENLKWASELGYKTIFWSCAYDDWDNNRQMSYEKAMNKLMSRLHNGEVLLLHPTSSTNAAILDEFLTTLEGMGYRFGNLYELTGNSMI
jgi:peptidoglycan-N-acetylmuramic acid deacetylase